MIREILVAAVLSMGIAAVTSAGAEEAAAARPMLTGAQIFAKHCSYCHGPGTDHPGTRQLRDTRGEEFALLEKRTDLYPDYIETIIRHGLNAMPPFKPTVITDAELDRLAKYLAKGNE